MSGNEIEPSTWLPPGAADSPFNENKRILAHAPALRAEDKEIVTDNKIRQDDISCPNCSSTQVTGSKRGFGFGKAITGGLLAGAVGLLAGVIGSSKVDVTCLKCGHRWQAGRKV